MAAFVIRDCVVVDEAGSLKACRSDAHLTIRGRCLHGKSLPANDICCDALAALRHLSVTLFEQLLHPCNLLRLNLRGARVLSSETKRLLTRVSVRDRCVVGVGLDCGSCCGCGSPWVLRLFILTRVMGDTRAHCSRWIGQYGICTLHYLTRVRTFYRNRNRFIFILR